MSSRSRGKSTRRGKGLDVIQPDAAGIDVGSEEHWVGVPEGRGPVRRFGAFTADLYELAQWLAECGVRSVAMESTGVYWIALFQILEERGFEVVLVNTKHLKNVPSRKSDVLDCQWLQKMHSFGLLAASFRPGNDICILRTLTRHRESLVRDCSVLVQRVQKALIQMNLLLHNVISDVLGVTGRTILNAILSGERDPRRLASMKDYRIKSDLETIAKALQGDFRPEHLFTLRQSLELYDAYHARIAECDAEIERHLSLLRTRLPENAPPLPKSTSSHRKPQRNEPIGSFRPALYRSLGTDLTQIDGIGVATALVLTAEVGPDLSRFPTEKHFASWLGLCPNPQISGGRRLRDRPRKVVNRAAQALRIATESLRNSRSALGAYFRRMYARLGPAKAIKATAHKLALMVYRVLKHGHIYVDPGAEAYNLRFRDRQLRSLRKRAKSLGLQLIEPQPQGAVS